MDNRESEPEARRATTAGLSEARVRQHLTRVLDSVAFSSAGRLHTLLEYVVNQVLIGRVDGLKETVIALEVFERGNDYDPRTDPIVRVMASRLRKRLAEYYAGQGSRSDVVITLPRGGYVPSILERATSSKRLSVAVGVAVGVAVVALVAAAGASWRTFDRGPGAPAGLRSVAVLPFDSFSEDSEQDHFAEGMTETLITGLAQIEGLRVISRSSVMRYREGRPGAPEIARQLNVRYLVEGSVQRDGGRVRVSAQLIEAGEDRHIWAQSYDRSLRDALALQAELAAAVATEIRGFLAPPSKGRSVDPRAQEAYFKGRYYWNRRTPAGIRRSVEYFEEAASIAPDWALSYAGIADAYNLLGSYRLSAMSDSHPRARAAAEQAIRLDPNLGEAYASLGTVISDYYWDWPAAEKAFEKATALNPNDSTGRQWYSAHLVKMKRFDEAVEEAQRGVENDPLSPIASANLAWILYYSRQYARARERILAVLDFHPGFPAALLDLGLIELQLGRPEAAQKAFERAHEGLGQPAAVLAHVAIAQAAQGDIQRAATTLRDLKKKAADGPPAPYAESLLHVGLGDSDAAFESLEAAYNQRDWKIGFAAVDPALDPLRGDPRLDLLLSRLDLPR